MAVERFVITIAREGEARASDSQSEDHGGGF